MRVRYRKNGITEDEYFNGPCCYSCKYCSKTTADGRGVCTHTDSKVYLYNGNNNCCSYSDAELVMCAECNTYFRSLSRHIEKHRMTVDQYKEKHGYNRGTPMNCATTSELHREHALERNAIRGQYKTSGSSGKVWRMRVEGKMNMVKKINIERNKDDE